MLFIPLAYYRHNPNLSWSKQVSWTALAGHGVGRSVASNTSSDYCCAIVEQEETFPLTPGNVVAMQWVYSDLHPSGYGAELSSLKSGEPAHLLEALLHLLLSVHVCPKILSNHPPPTMEYLPPVRPTSMSVEFGKWGFTFCHLPQRLWPLWASTPLYISTACSCRSPNVPHSMACLWPSRAVEKDFQWPSMQSHRALKKNVYTAQDRYSFENDFMLLILLLSAFARVNKLALRVARNTRCGWYS